MIGIMQGRLVPREMGRYQCFPWQRWRDEFYFAAEDGFASIEMIYEEREGHTHPLMTEDGILEIWKCSATTGIGIHTICADEFMVQPLHAEDSDQAWSRFDRLIESARALHTKYITVPCLETSSLRGNDEAAERLVRGLRSRTSALDAADVTIGLETDLPPQQLRDLLDRIDHPRVGVTYDSGNSAASGFDVREEFAAYADWIVVVHVKDRPVGAPSVPLGQGAVDFEAVIDGLHAVDFDGPIIMQAARAEEDGQDRAVARAQAQFFEESWQ